MAIFKTRDGEVYYNEQYWQEIRIPDDALPVDNHSEYLTTTLQYIGPIVDGEPIERFPLWDYSEVMWYRTYADCKGLIHPPLIKKRRSCQMFAGCDRLELTLPVLDRMIRQPGSLSGDLFEGVVTKQIVPEMPRPKHVNWTDVDYPYFIYTYLLLKYLGLNVDITDVSDLDIQATLKDLIDGNVDVLEEGFICDQSGAYVRVIKISKYSEIERGGNWDHVVAFENKYIAYADGFFKRLRIYLLSDDFEFDKEDDDYFRHRGFRLTQKFYSSPLNVGKDNTVVLTQDVMVTASTPLNCFGTVTITGEKGTSLYLTSKGATPCIGPAPHDNMSYGRWEPSRDKLDKIIIDGVTVICKESVPNFAIGNYGTNYLPTIELVNGGQLVCPEMRGTRVMVQSGAEDLSGSTKRCEPAIYELEYYDVSNKIEAMTKSVTSF